MAGETVITVVGNLTSDPELKFTPSGAAVANFTVASTPRTFDKQTNEWKDGDPLFIRCDAWRQMAENVAESLQKGQRVVVTGSLKVRNFERQDGSKGTSVEMNVDEVGPSLKWATAKVTKTSRSGGGDFGGGQSGGGGQANPWAQQPAQGAPADGGSAPQQGGSDAWAGGGGSTDEPPF
jgi:single-strand DNA-binding protein